MKKIFFAFLLLLSLSQNTLAQVFCIPSDQPRYPEIARRAGLSISFIVRFDVGGRTPHNIKINVLDTSMNHADTMVELFSPVIRSYLHQLCFQIDIKDFALKIHFQVRSRDSISVGYVEKIGEDEICIIERSAKMSAGPNFKQCDCNKDN
jgi:hypothetical protein